MNGSRLIEPDTETPEPRANGRLVGQSVAEQTLLKSWRSGRMPHAWLFTGPRGVGKATLAFRFARFVLAGGDRGDDHGGGDDGGGDHGGGDDLALSPDHSVFRRIAVGSHPDLKIVERRNIQRKKGEAPDRKQGEIVVSDIRAVGDFLALTSGEGGWRVVIVDSADEMNRHAANALLKLLEEPPSRVLLILLAHAPGKLPATVRSRCRVLPLARLDAERMRELLRDYRPDIDSTEADLLAMLGDGSIGRALALADAGGGALYRDMIEQLRLPELDVGALHAFADRLARPGAEESFATATELLTWWLARLVGLAARGADLTAAAMVPGEAELMHRLVGSSRHGLAPQRLDQWVAVWDKITRLMAQAERVNLDRKQVVLSAFLAIEEEAAARA